MNINCADCERIKDLKIAVYDALQKLCHEKNTFQIGADFEKYLPDGFFKEIENEL
jgi:hypothetical protein